MTTATVAERVAAGAAWLDQHEPGWHERIDVYRLDLWSPCRCILGQLYSDYFVGLDVHPEVAVRPDLYGFEPHEQMDDEWVSEEYAELTAAWRDFITTRRTPNDAGRISTAGAVILIAIACIIALAATGNWGQ